MKKPWRGKPCAACGKTNGYFERVTYEGAPDGGVPVHSECFASFFAKLELEKWKLEMEEWHRRYKLRRENDYD